MLEGRDNFDQYHISGTDSFIDAIMEETGARNG
jgi:hypothetical protein